ncbi:transmembrane protein, partial [Cystoisospora suis]
MTNGGVTIECKVGLERKTTPPDRKTGEGGQNDRMEEIIQLCDRYYKRILEETQKKQTTGDQPREEEEERKTDAPPSLSSSATPGAGLTSSSSSSSSSGSDGGKSTSFLSSSLFGISSFSSTISLTSTLFWKLLLRCDLCGDVVAMHKYDSHRQNDCPVRRCRFAPFGCGVSVHLLGEEKNEDKNKETSSSSSFSSSSSSSSSAASPLSVKKKNQHALHLHEKSCSFRLVKCPCCLKYCTYRVSYQLVPTSSPLLKGKQESQGLQESSSPPARISSSSSSSSSLQPRPSPIATPSHLLLPSTTSSSLPLQVSRRGGEQDGAREGEEEGTSQRGAVVMSSRECFLSTEDSLHLSSSSSCSSAGISSRSEERSALTCLRSPPGKEEEDQTTEALRTVTCVGEGEEEEDDEVEKNTENRSDGSTVDMKDQRPPEECKDKKEKDSRPSLSSLEIPRDEIFVASSLDADPHPATTTVYHTLPASLRDSPCEGEENEPREKECEDLLSSSSSSTTIAAHPTRALPLEKRKKTPPPTTTTITEQGSSTTSTAGYGASYKAKLLPSASSSSGYVPLCGSDLRERRASVETSSGEAGETSESVFLRRRGSDSMAEFDHRKSYKDILMKPESSTVCEEGVEKEDGEGGRGRRRDRR